MKYKSSSYMKQSTLKTEDPLANKTFDGKLWKSAQSIQGLNNAILNMIARK